MRLSLLVLVLVTLLFLPVGRVEARHSLPSIVIIASPQAITPTDLLTLDYGFNGSPFLDTVATSSLDLKTLDYGFNGAPFVSNYVDSSLAITNAPSTWTINGITGSGKMSLNTTYYSNPLGDTVSPSATVVDGECRFTMTNTSSVATDVYVNIGNFTGGDASTNSNTGSNGATSFGAYSYYSGMTYASKVVAKTTGSSVLKSNLAATTNLKWGIELKTQSNAWTSPNDMTSTATISVVAH